MGGEGGELTGTRDGLAVSSESDLPPGRTFFPETPPRVGVKIRGESEPREGQEIQRVPRLRKWYPIEERTCRGRLVTKEMRSMARYSTKVTPTPNQEERDWGGEQIM